MLIPEKYFLKKGDFVQGEQGRYRIEQELGEGGFAKVFAVSSDDSKELKALKVINLYEQMKEEREFFKKSATHEYKAGSMVNSENVVRSLDKGEILANPFIVMEYCANGTLEDWIMKKKPLNMSRITAIARDVLKGMEALHQNGIIHRDIKAENILFDAQDRAKVADFGIAALVNFRKTERNWRGHVKDPLFLTTLYCAPEQMDTGKTFGLTRPTMDIFAFGVMMYFVISGGKFPYGSEYDNEAYTLNKSKGSIVNGGLRQFRGETSDELLRLVENCLQVKPEKRIQSTQEALGYLGIQSDVETKTQKTGNGYLLRVLHGEDVGKCFYLNNLAKNKQLRLLRIGYAGVKDLPTNDIPLSETFTEWISNRHASLEITSEGRWFIKDGQFYEKNGVKSWHNSKNGVQIGSDDVNSLGKELRVGDIITIGDVRMRFEAV
jgi:serine/threonine protein kinase